MGYPTLHGSENCDRFLACPVSPSVFFQRVANADVVFVLSSRRLDDKSPANQCVIRSALSGTRKIEIPVRTKCVPIDQAEVAERSSWFPKMQQELQRAYSGLLKASAAAELLEESMLGITSPWLTDPLMHAFVMTLTGPDLRACANNEPVASVLEA